MNLYTAFSLHCARRCCLRQSPHDPLPNTIAVVHDCVLAVLLILLGKLHVVSINDEVTQQIQHFNFHDLLVNGILSFLLFAGALSIDSQRLRDHQWEVGTGIIPHR